MLNLYDHIQYGPPQTGRREGLVERLIAAVAALSIMLGQGGLTRGDVVYGPWSGYYDTENGQPMGQTFRMPGTYVSKIGLFIRGMQSQALAADLMLYRGEGFDPAKLVATAPITVPAGFTGWRTGWFSGKRMYPGQMYTLRIVEDDPLWLLVNWQPWGSGFSPGDGIIRGGTVWNDFALYIDDPWVENTGFDEGLTGYDVDAPPGGAATAGGGLAHLRIGSDPAAATQDAANATSPLSGRAVSIWQNIATPDEPFSVALDCRFNDPGVCQVWLGGTMLSEFSAGGAESQFRTHLAPVTSAMLHGATDVPLRVCFDGQPNASLSLDALYLTDIPEPTTAAGLLAGVLALARRGRAARP